MPKYQGVKDKFYMKFIATVLVAAVVATSVPITFRESASLPEGNSPPCIAKGWVWGQSQLAPGSRVEGQRIQEMPDDLLVRSHREALKQLSRRQREVLTQLFIEDKTPAQIMQELHISQPAVSATKIKGLRALKGLLDPESDYQVVLRNQHLLDRLPPRQGSVLRELFIESKTRAQVARKLRITGPVVSILKGRGLRSLRKLLDPNSDYQVVVRNQHLFKYLPPRRGLALKAFYLENKSRKQVARELKIGVEPASNLRRRGLKSLRKLLIESGDIRGSL